MQFSDPPRTGLEPGEALDRLPPGQGSYPFREFFAIMAAKGYGGFASYEAPNEKTWKRDPTDDRARGHRGHAHGAAAVSYDYKKHFGEITLTQDLTTLPAERTWRQQAPEEGDGAAPVRALPRL